jgi:hypothetical protein
MAIREFEEIEIMKSPKSADVLNDATKIGTKEEKLVQ